MVEFQVQTRELEKFVKNLETLTDLALTNASLKSIGGAHIESRSRYLGALSAARFFTCCTQSISRQFSARSQGSFEV